VTTLITAAKETRFMYFSFVVVVVVVYVFRFVTATSPRGPSLHITSRL